MLLRRSIASCDTCGFHIGIGAHRTMREYLDMGICLVVYLVTVVAVGGAIGLFLDWL